MINLLKKGDIIGVIAPSRPLWNIKKEVDLGLKRLEKDGFKIKKGNNLEKHFFYSAGTSKERVDDLHSMFLDKSVKAIFCATGGASSIELIRKINFDIIKKNPKPFIGYSDITTLLLAIDKKKNNIAIHGPNIFELSYLDDDPYRQLIDFLTNSKSKITLPEQMDVFKHGKSSGKIIGGNIILMNALLASNFFPILNDKILFWEDIGESPAMIALRLRELEISGKIKKIKGMVVGFLSGCIDKKYPDDNRKIKDIVLEVFSEYNFPIIQVNYFGHDIKNFYSFPFGRMCEIDTEKKKFKIY